MRRGSFLRAGAITLAAGRGTDSWLALVPTLPLLKGRHWKGLRLTAEIEVKGQRYPDAAGWPTEAAMRTGA